MDRNTRRAYVDEAKKRMKSGYWQDVLIQRNESIENSTEKGGNCERALSEYNMKLRRTFESKCLPYKDEETLIEKIRQLDTGGSIVTNPIGMLTDKKHFDSLDEFGRERYIFELAAAYRRIKNELTV